MPKFLHNFFKWTLIIVAALLITGISYEQYSCWSLEKNVRKGQTFVKVSGHELHYVKKGKGNCTVVFESGLASDHHNWTSVQDSVSKYAVTLSYDRSGMFLSEAGDTAKTNQSIANDLLQLLEKTNCPKPYIVVGHSIGAIYLRSFIASHQKDIAGIVFVEAAHPLQMKKSTPEMLASFSQPPEWAIATMVNTGLFRVALNFIQPFPEIPATHPFHHHFQDYFYKSYRAILKEAENDSLNFQDAESYPAFGNIPLIVIKGDVAKWSDGIKDPKVRAQFHQLVFDLQNDFLNLSTNSKMVKAERSGHVVQVHDSDLISKEIITLIRNPLQ